MSYVFTNIKRLECEDKALLILLEMPIAPFYRFLAENGHSIDKALDKLTMQLMEESK